MTPNSGIMEQKRNIWRKKEKQERDQIKKQPWITDIKSEEENPSL